MTQKGGDNITYDVFNKPTNINGQQFAYAADHSRYKQIAADGTITYYLLGGTFEEIKESNQTTYNSYVDGVFLHQEIKPIYGYQSTYKRRYFIKDHLDSITVITNENGQIDERLSFNTWGERRANDWSNGSYNLNGTTTRGYTGHEMLDDNGLIHMNGRVYDPTAGRFLSADLFIQAPTNTQSYNRYSYVFNNPLSYTDPSGYESCSSEPTQGSCTVVGNPAPPGRDACDLACQDLEDAREEQREEQKRLDEQQNLYGDGAVQSSHEVALLLWPGYDFGTCLSQGCSGGSWVIATIGIIPGGKGVTTGVKVALKASAKATNKISYGKNTLAHFRSHSQHIRETARKLGIDIPKGPKKLGTQAAMKEFISKVVNEGTSAVGHFKSVKYAQFSRLGDAIVVRRSNGEFLSFLDTTKGGQAHNLPTGL